MGLGGASRSLAFVLLILVRPLAVEAAVPSPESHFGHRMGADRKLVDWAEVVRYYFSDRNRLAEVEALVVEQNVVDWVLSKAKVNEKQLGFDELMAEQQG